MSTVNDNYDDVYHGVREGYSGGYYPSGGGWDESLDYGDVYGVLDELLGMEDHGSYHVKLVDGGQKEEYRISGLDVTIQKQIMELLEDLKEKNGLSFIFICHNLALVQMFCDRVLVLYEGKVVESGIPDDIINEPKEEYTQRLVDAVLS